MEYKGYQGLPQIDEESGSLYGHMAGLRDVITFQGESVPEQVQSFRDSVDEYLDFCKSLGRSPEKPFSGQFMLRIDPVLHRKLSVAAEVEGVGLNAMVQAILEQHADRAAARAPAAQSIGVRRIHKLMPKGTKLPASGTRRSAAKAALPAPPVSGKPTKRSSKAKGGGRKSALK
jgi:predicted HicB family RNase H-like nuclease